MTKKIKAAVGGTKHDIFQAPAWDYANGKRIAVGSSSAATVIAEGLWLLFAEGGDIYIKIGSGTPTASGSLAGSFPLVEGQRWGETIIGEDQKIAAIRKSADAILWAIPAQSD